MSTVYLGIGSNVEAEGNIRSGIEALRAAFAAIELSPIYRARAIGFRGADFINLVARVETSLTPLQMKAFLHELEDRHGRDRSRPKYSDRTLDIDILLFDDLWLISPGLEIPRDEILSSAHVLRPLAELAPTGRHPALGESFAALWQAFKGDRGDLAPVEL